jgi:hypothetical protein
MLIPTKHWTTALALAVCGAVVTGCSGDEISRTLGFVHDAPDEFTVTTRAPLAMPPSYTLQPPTPGAARPQEQSERAKAEQALVPQMALGGTDEAPSPGQQALVQAAGPTPQPGIRTAVDQEARLSRNSEGLVDRMMFWRKPLPPGIVVDPQKEAQRLRENAALGHSPESGETPVVQPKRRGWLEGIF